MTISLAAAFDLFRRGLFSEARAAALEIVADEPQNFWAYYLAAVSSAFEPNLKEFEKYLAELDTFSVKNAYLYYLKAYYSLLRGDIEKALWYYLEITSDGEGWLARSLVKKFRKIKELKNIAYRVADFIVLPTELPPPVNLIPRPILKDAAVSSPSPSVKAKSGAEAARGWQFDTEKKAPRPVGVIHRARNVFGRFPYRLVFIAGFLIFALAGVSIVVWQNWQDKKKVVVPDLQVADSAAVMPAVDSAKILYQYKTRNRIISDFERAKSLLKERKVNQARYLLNQLLHSNADFQTREKSRIFLGFAADPDYTDFNDNLRMKDLFENVKLRRDAVVIVSGELRDAASETGGVLYQLIVREEGEEYRVHAYKAAGIKEEKLQSSKPQVQVYGRFKGLTGEQKAIYLEALRVWR